MPAISGTVAILGRANVGKSTLLNHIVGTKLAIVSDKPQTTRQRIIGVYNGDASQIVFVDTPGVHRAQSSLGRYMVGQAMGAIEEVDAVLLVTEAPGATRGRPGARANSDKTEERIVDSAVRAGKPIVLAINKVDRIKQKADLFPVLIEWEKRATFAALVPVSATRGTGTDGLIKELLALLPEGPPRYGEDVLTDRTERFLAAELVREQLFNRLYEELPYATAVEIEAWEERAAGDVVIDASILVEKDNQKAIVLGKSGSMIREIGSSARAEITQLLGRPAHLRLYVKVAPQWSDSPAALRDLGYGEER